MKRKLPIRIWSLQSAAKKASDKVGGTVVYKGTRGGFGGYAVKVGNKYLRIDGTLDNPNLKLAKQMKSRYLSDVRAGHKDAAEYWRGQAAAYFTGNPNIKIG